MATGDTTNVCPDLSISFHICHRKKKEIVGQFALKSTMNFDSCVDCVDGILIWTNKPSKQILLLTDFGVFNFLCGKKKRCRLNM